jgi:hypothetical protein
VQQGFHWRELPMPDDGAAMRKLASLSDEAFRWKGAPWRTEEEAGRQLALDCRGSRTVRNEVTVREACVEVLGGERAQPEVA